MLEQMMEKVLEKVTDQEFHNFDFSILFSDGNSKIQREHQEKIKLLKNNPMQVVYSQKPITKNVPKLHQPEGIYLQTVRVIENTVVKSQNNLSYDLMVRIHLTQVEGAEKSFSFSEVFENPTQIVKITETLISGIEESGSPQLTQDTQIVVKPFTIRTFVISQKCRSK